MNKKIFLKFSDEKYVVKYALLILCFCAARGSIPIVSFLTGFCLFFGRASFNYGEREIEKQSRYCNHTISRVCWLVLGILWKNKKLKTTISSGWNLSITLGKWSFQNQTVNVRAELNETGPVSFVCIGLTVSVTKQYRIL